MADKSRFPQGKHEAEIVAQGTTVAKTGTLQLFIEVTIDGFDSSVTIYMPVTERTQGRVDKSLAVMGFTGDSIEQFNPDNARCCSVVGKRIPVRNKHEEWNGDIRDKFEVLTPYEQKEATGAEIRSKAEGLNKLLRARKAAAPKERSAETQKTIDDSDLPF